jgi:hypothetical protein
MKNFERELKEQLLKTTDAVEAVARAIEVPNEGTIERLIKGYADLQSETYRGQYSTAMTAIEALRKQRDIFLEALQAVPASDYVSYNTAQQAIKKGNEFNGTTTI